MAGRHGRGRAHRHGLAPTSTAFTLPTAASRGWRRRRSAARTPTAPASPDGYVTDVTERKALEAELRNAREQAETADRAKSRFLATISHELRTPLVAVSGTLDVLSTTRLTAEQRDLTEIALRSARSLLALIGDVLDFSKIEAGHLDIVTAAGRRRGARGATLPPSTARPRRRRA